MKVEGDAELRHGDRLMAFNIEEPGSVVVDLLRLLHQAAELFVDDGSALRLVAGPDLELVVRPAEQDEAWTVNRADGTMIVCGPSGEMHRWT